MARKKIKRVVYGFRADEEKIATAEKNCMKKKTTLREQLENRLEQIADKPETIKP